MSDRLTQDVEKTKLEKKISSRIGYSQATELVQKLESSSKEELEETLLNLSKTQQGIINTRNADKTLSDLQDQVREQNRTYGDQLRANKDLTRLVSIIISEKYGDELMDRKTTQDSEEGSEE